MVNFGLNLLQRYQHPDLKIAGYKMEWSDRYHVFAVSDDGEKFYIEMDGEKPIALLPRKSAREIDVERSQNRLKLGQIFIDTDNPIPLVENYQKHIYPKDW
jgi:hypothetical protein